MKSIKKNFSVGISITPYPHYNVESPIFCLLARRFLDGPQLVNIVMGEGAPD